MLDLAEDLEAYLKELSQNVDTTWYQKAIDHVDVEENDFIEVVPRIGSKFAVYELKLKKQSATFER